MTFTQAYAQAGEASPDAPYIEKLIQAFGNTAEEDSDGRSTALTAIARNFELTPRIASTFKLPAPPSDELEEEARVDAWDAWEEQTRNAVVGTPIEQPMANVARQMRLHGVRAAQGADTGTTSDVIQRGGQSLAQGLSGSVLSLGSLAARVTGNREAAESIADASKDLNDWVGTFFEENPDRDDKLVSKIAEAVGEYAPEIVATLYSGGGTLLLRGGVRGAGAATAPAMLNRAVQVGSLTKLAGKTYAGAYEEALAAGASDPTLTAAKAAAAQLPLELFGPERLAAGFVKKLAPLGRAGWKDLARGVRDSAVEEAFTGTVGELTKDAVIAGDTGTSVKSAGAYLEGGFEEGLIGGLLGGIFKGIGNVQHNRLLGARQEALGAYYDAYRNSVADPLNGDLTSELEARKTALTEILAGETAFTADADQREASILDETRDDRVANISPAVAPPIEGILDESIDRLFRPAAPVLAPGLPAGAFDNADAALLSERTRGAYYRSVVEEDAATLAFEPGVFDEEQQAARSEAARLAEEFTREVGARDTLLKDAGVDSTDVAEITGLLQDPATKQAFQDSMGRIAALRSQFVVVLNTTPARAASRQSRTAAFEAAFPAATAPANPATADNLEARVAARTAEENFTRTTGVALTDDARALAAARIAPSAQFDLGPDLTEVESTLTATMQSLREQRALGTPVNLTAPDAALKSLQTLASARAEVEALTQSANQLAAAIPAGAEFTPEFLRPEQFDTPSIDLGPDTALFEQLRDKRRELQQARDKVVAANAAFGDVQRSMAAADAIAPARPTPVVDRASPVRYDPLETRVSPAMARAKWDYEAAQTRMEAETNPLARTIAAPRLEALRVQLDAIAQQEFAGSIAELEADARTYAELRASMIWGEDTAAVKALAIVGKAYGAAIEARKARPELLRQRAEADEQVTTAWSGARIETQNAIIAGLPSPSSEVDLEPGDKALLDLVDKRDALDAKLNAVPELDDALAEVEVTLGGFAEYDMTGLPPGEALQLTLVDAEGPVSVANLAPETKAFYDRIRAVTAALEHVTTPLATELVQAEIVRAQAGLAAHLGRQAQRQAAIATQAQRILLEAAARPDSLLAPLAGTFTLLEDIRTRLGSIHEVRTKLSDAVRAYNAAYAPFKEKYETAAAALPLEVMRQFNAPLADARALVEARAAELSNLERLIDEYGVAAMEAWFAIVQADVRQQAPEVEATVTPLLPFRSDAVRSSEERAAIMRKFFETRAFDQAEMPEWLRRKFTEISQFAETVADIASVRTPAARMRPTQRRRRVTPAAEVEAILVEGASPAASDQAVIDEVQARGTPAKIQARHRAEAELAEQVAMRETSLMAAVESPTEATQALENAEAAEVRIEDIISDRPMVPTHAPSVVVSPVPVVTAEGASLTQIEAQEAAQDAVDALPESEAVVAQQALDDADVELPTSGVTPEQQAAYDAILAYRAAARADAKAAKARAATARLAATNLRISEEFPTSDSVGRGQNAKLSELLDTVDARHDALVARIRVAMKARLDAKPVDRPEWDRTLRQQLDQLQQAGGITADQHLVAVVDTGLFFSRRAQAAASAGYAVRAPFPVPRHITFRRGMSPDVYAFVDPATGAVGINADVVRTQADLLTKLGHEGLHLLVREQPDVLREAERLASRDLDAARATVEAAGYAPDQVREESAIVAMERAWERSPELQSRWGRLVSRLRIFLKRLMGRDVSDDVIALQAALLMRRGIARALSGRAVGVGPRQFSRGAEKPMKLSAAARAALKRLKPRTQRRGGDDLLSAARRASMVPEEAFTAEERTEMTTLLGRLPGPDAVAAAARIQDLVSLAAGRVAQGITDEVATELRPDMSPADYRKMIADIPSLLRKHMKDAAPAQSDAEAAAKAARRADKKTAKEVAAFNAALVRFRGLRARIVETTPDGVPRRGTDGRVLLLPEAVALIDEHFGVADSDMKRMARSNFLDSVDSLLTLQVDGETGVFTATTEDIETIAQAMDNFLELGYFGESSGVVVDRVRGLHLAAELILNAKKYHTSGRVGLGAKHFEGPRGFIRRISESHEARRVLNKILGTVVTKIESDAAHFYKLGAERLEAIRKSVYGDSVISPESDFRMSFLYILHQFEVGLHPDVAATQVIHKARQSVKNYANARSADVDEKSHDERIKVMERLLAEVETALVRDTTYNLGEKVQPGRSAALLAAVDQLLTPKELAYLQGLREFFEEIHPYQKHATLAHTNEPWTEFTNYIPLLTVRDGYGEVKADSIGEALRMGKSATGDLLAAVGASPGKTTYDRTSGLSDTPGLHYGHSVQRAAANALRLASVNMFVKPHVTTAATVFFTPEIQEAFGQAKDNSASASLWFDQAQRKLIGAYSSALTSSDYAEIGIGAITSINRAYQRMSLSGVRQLLTQPTQIVVSSVIQNSATLGPKHAVEAIWKAFDALAHPNTPMGKFTKTMFAREMFVVQARTENRMQADGDARYDLGVAQTEFESAMQGAMRSAAKAVGLNSDTIDKFIGNADKAGSWLSALQTAALRYGDGYAAKAAAIVEYISAWEARHPGRGWDYSNPPEYSAEVANDALVTVEAVITSSGTASRGEFNQTNNVWKRGVRGLLGSFATTTSQATTNLVGMVGAGHRAWERRKAAEKAMKASDTPETRAAFEEADQMFKEFAFSAAGIFKGNMMFAVVGTVATAATASAIAAALGDDEEREQLTNLYVRQMKLKASGAPASPEINAQIKRLEERVRASARRKESVTDADVARQVITNTATSLIVPVAATDVGKWAVNRLVDPLMKPILEHEIDSRVAEAEKREKAALKSFQYKNAARAKVEQVTLKRIRFIETDDEEVFGGTMGAAWRNIDARLWTPLASDRELSMADYGLMLSAFGVGQSDVNRLLKGLSDQNKADQKE